jgi:hypothetical protein
VPGPEGKDYVASQYRQLRERSFEDVISLPMQAIDRPSQRIDPVLATRLRKLEQHRKKNGLDIYSPTIPPTIALQQTHT